MQQAGRISDYTAFIYLGRLIEFGPTPKFSQINRKTDGGLHYWPIWYELTEPGVIRVRTGAGARKERSITMVAKTFSWNI